MDFVDPYEMRTVWQGFIKRSGLVWSITSGNLNMLPGGVFSVVLGLCFVVWHKSFGSGAVRFQHKLLNIEFDERAFQITYLIVGIAPIIIGVSVLISAALR